MNISNGNGAAHRLGVELPTPGACQPVSPAAFVGGFFPTQILQGHNQIVMLNEWVAVPRRIYMDGRGFRARTGGR